MPHKRVPEELRANLDTIRMFEDEGRRYRIYVTMGGALACERHDPKTDTWVHMPLREASESELAAMLSARYGTNDEEIARSMQGLNRR